MTIKSKKMKKQLKSKRIRKRLQKSERNFRLSVFKSDRYIWLQLIDDIKNETIAAANSKELLKKLKDLDKTKLALETGKLLAERAKKKGVAKVVFDRGPYRYHGRIKAVAEGARAGGLDF